VRQPGYDGACWPDERQTTMLRVAICEPEVAAREWAELRRELEIDEIWDPEAQRLLPLILRNLREAGYDDPDFPRMKGIQRRTWFENQRRIHAVKPVIAQLHDVGVETLFLKGVPLALQYYRDVGLRPMADVDVLVPYASYDTALDVLEGDGFRDVLDIPRDRRRRMYHGAGMLHPDGRSIDLHWQLALPFVLPHAASDSTTDFFAAAVDLDLDGLTVPTLCSADMLLHLVVHGLWAGSSANVRWVADAAVVIRTAGDELDWDRVLDQTVRRDLVVPVSNALRYLDRVVDTPVPPRAVNELLRVPVRRRTRRAYDRIMGDTQETELLGGLEGTRAYWSRQSYKWGTWRAARELPYFLQDNWNLDHPAQVPVEAVRKAGKRLALVAGRGAQ